MLTHPTIDQLRALKLDGMADAFTELQSQDRAKDLDHAEWLALLLDREAANRSEQGGEHQRGCVERRIVRKVGLTTPITPRQTGNSQPKLPVSNLNTYTLQSS